jgi:hypothetical protein
MKVDKDTIVQFLRQKGDDDKAQEAESQLPGQVDTEKDEGLLDSLGIDVGSLIAMVKDDGLGGALGGLLK